MILRYRVLVLDDVVGKAPANEFERLAREAYCESLGLHDESEADPSHEVVADAVFASGQEGEAKNARNSLEAVDVAFRSGWPSVTGQYWSAALVDMKFGDDPRFGLQVISHLHEVAPDLPIFVVSSADQLQVAEGETLRDSVQRFGAQDFLAASGVSHEVHDEWYRSTPSNLRARLDDVGLMPDPSQEIVGFSLSMCLALRQLRSLANCPDGVGQALIRGEPGSGKSFIARYVLRELARRSGRTPEAVPYYEVPLTKDNRDLQEVTLFGTVGAANLKARAGAFQLAKDRGVVFLDEIGNLSPESQGALLGPLQIKDDQNGKPFRLVRRTGETDGTKSRCFVLAATHEHLEKKLTAGEFNEPLFQRFSGRMVWMPPLRERTEDLPLLVKHFISKHLRGHSRSADVRIDVPLEVWLKFASKASVRELEQHIQKGLSNSVKTLFTANDFFSADSMIVATGNRNPPRLDPAESETREFPERGRTAIPTNAPVSELVATLKEWSPRADMSATEFDGAFQRLDRAFAEAKLRLWRELVRRQEESAGSINLLATARKLLSAPNIPNSKSGDLALRLFDEARITDRPLDPLLAQIWDRRRRNRKSPPDDLTGDGADKVKES